MADTSDVRPVIPEPFAPPFVYVEWKGALCDHCFCETAIGLALAKPHVQCCMCRTRRPSPAPETEAR